MLNVSDAPLRLLLWLEDLLCVCVCVGWDSAGLSLCVYSLFNKQTNKEKSEASFVFFPPAASNRLSFYLFCILNVEWRKIPWSVFVVKQQDAT